MPVAAPPSYRHGCFPQLPHWHGPLDTSANRKLAHGSGPGFPLTRLPPRSRIYTRVTGFCIQISMNSRRWRASRSALMGTWALPRALRKLLRAAVLAALSTAVFASVLQAEALAPASAAETSRHLLLSAELDDGFRMLYNLQFDAARAQFTSWKEKNPEQPLGPALQAGAILLRSSTEKACSRQTFF